jgi:hypothetical protein
MSGENFWKRSAGVAIYKGKLGLISILEKTKKCELVA